jgi:hypothetical protein
MAAICGTLAIDPMNKHRLPLRFFLSGLLLLAAMLTPLKAGSITTSVTCTTSGGNTTNVAACSASAGQVNASSSATYLLSTNSLATTFTASASATPAGSLTSNAALANAAITLNLDTAGSERAGYVLIDWTANENSCCGIGGGSVVYDLGSGVGGSCGAPPSNVCHYQLFEPVTLGSDFTFTESEQFQATTLDENDGGNLSATLNLQFYEADKTTPVDVFETPEPSALSLIGMGLIFLVVARVRR